jgi:hypothetical protein
MKIPSLAVALLTLAGMAQAQSLRIDGGAIAHLESISVVDPHYDATAAASANPFSISGSYRGGVLAGLFGYQRNGAASTLWSVAASVKALTALKLVAGYADQDRSNTMTANESTTAWVIGANFTLSDGTLLLGYGSAVPEGVAGTRQWSLGYAYPLSRRAHVYADASGHKAASSVRHFDRGIRAAF